MAAVIPLRAIVTSFDRAVGLGVVHCDDGTDLGFHATAIIDGSRDVEVGSRVLIAVTSGHGGIREAGTVSPL